MANGNNIGNIWALDGNNLVDVERKRKKRQRQQKREKGGRRFNKTLFWLTILLLILGSVFVADVSSAQAMSFFGDPYFFARQQIVWGLLGIAGMIAVSFVPYLFYKKWSYFVCIGGMLLLVAVLIPGVGLKVLGARRWISLGFFSFQPAELLKIGTAIFVAAFLDEEMPLVYIFGIVGLMLGLVMLQPDFGTALVLTSIAGVQLFVFGMPLLLMVLLGAGGGLGGAALIFLSSYRKERFLAFIEGIRDPINSSYHVKQILIALGSGGVFGVGLGKSRQKQLFLPETATDSVFAIIAEEIGFVGAGLILLMLLIYILMIFLVALRATDRFGMLLAVGLLAWIGVQTFLNLSSMVALTPLTGIPLPFFSYGGSSLTMMLLAVGILLNISKYE